MAEIDVFEEAVWAQDHPRRIVELLRLALPFLYCGRRDGRTGRVGIYCLKCGWWVTDGHKPGCWVGEAEEMIG